MEIFFFIGGVVTGVILTLVLNLLKNRETSRIAKALLEQAEQARTDELEIINDRLKESFAALSYEALTENSINFLNVAANSLKNQQQLGEQALENRQKTIDQALVSVGRELNLVQETVLRLEKDREQKFGELTNQLRVTAEQTAKLSDTAQQLQAALSNSQLRGQWGERMAEDILQNTGLVEGINYAKQRLTETGSRPDYTFFLPKQRKLNMDVKFPLDNYLYYLRTDETSQKEAYKQQFLKDARARIKEVTTRNYINPAEQTVDFVLVFIPNEQVYSFLHENDHNLLDESLKNKVILCSPLTLYAFLAIIRQAVESFCLEQTTGRMLQLFSNFQKQWENFGLSFDKIGKKLDEAKNEYQNLVNARRNQVDKVLQQIEQLRQENILMEKEVATTEEN